MKIHRNLLIVLTVTLLTFTACKKYPDGPGISFRSKSERVANNWKVQQYLKNGVDYTADLISNKMNYTEVMTKEGSWTYSYINSNDNKLKSGAGTWQFINNNMQILRMNDGNAFLLNILKLKENELWFWYMDDNDRREYHLIAN